MLAIQKEKVFKDSMFYNIVAIVTITVALRGCYFILQVIMAKGFSVLLLELALQDTFAYCLGNIIFCNSVVSSDRKTAEMDRTG